MKLRHFVFAACASAMTFAACEQVVDPAAPDMVPEIYTVKLDCAGEIEVNQAPLTRVTPDNDDLYGVQVYYKPVSSSSSSYKHYAYGLFDDLSDVTIDLIANHAFKFCVDVVDDGKTKVYNESGVGYGFPYKSSNGVFTAVSNVFIYSEESSFIGLGDSFQIPGSSDTYWNPEDVETYYGETEVVPTSDGQTVLVFLKRMVFGLKVVADDFLKEGEVKVDFTSNAKGMMNDYVLTPENKSVEHIYTYWNRKGWSAADQLTDAYSSIPVKLTWTKADGTVLTLKSQTVKVNRLMQTIVNVTFYEDTAIEGAKLSVQFEDQGLVEDGPEFSFGGNQSDYEF